MPMWVVSLLVATGTPEVVDDVRDALASAARAGDEERLAALEELAAVAGLEPAAFGDRASRIRAARDRVGGFAAWRIREESGGVDVELVDPSGHLDRLRAWFVTESGRERVRATGTGLRRRIETPRAWPQRGRLELEASSSLIAGAPALMRHVVSPLRPAPEAPLGSGAPTPAPGVRATARGVPWWLLVAGVAAAGAVGLGVWQEAR